MVSKAAEAKSFWESRRCLYQTAVLRADVFPATRVMGIAAAMEMTRNGRINYGHALARAGRLGLSPDEARDGLEELITDGWLVDINEERKTAMLQMPQEPWGRAEDQPGIRIATLAGPPRSLSTSATPNTSTFWAGKGKATA